jgi:hypothetical protein
MSIKLIQSDVISRLNLKHNLKYDYSLVVYKNQRTKIKIICPKHGIFEQTTKNHLNGQGCPKCNYYWDKDDFIQKSIEIHGNKYNYSNIIFENLSTKIKIICPNHGIFEQLPHSHLQKNGCKICFLEKQSTSREKFVQQSKEIHGEKYDYKLVEYKNNHIKVRIICNKCKSILDIKPHAHIHLKRGCPRCGKNISNKETKWLDFYSIPKEYRQYKIKINNKHFKVDGYDPLTNTIYEYYGDYWHGNPNKYNPNEINKRCKKTFGELYEETLQREKILKENGYNVVAIWENDLKSK